MKKIVTIALIAFALFLCKADVLLWQVDDTAKVDGTPIQKWLMASPYIEDDDHWVAARVKLTDANGTVLGIYFDSIVEDGTWGVWIGDNGDGSWGSGVPTGNQSPTGHKTFYASLDDPTTTILENPATIEALFIMELGYNAYDPNIDDYVWTTIAQALPEETYETLRANYMYGEGSIAPPTQKVWTPTEFYTTSVPEPSSTILCLLGLSLFMLKRKSNN